MIKYGTFLKFKLHYHFVLVCAFVFLPSQPCMPVAIMSNVMSCFHDCHAETLQKHCCCFPIDCLLCSTLMLALQPIESFFIPFFFFFGFLLSTFTF